MVGSLTCKLRTELALASTPAHKQHHAARDLQGQSVAMVFLDHRQGEINPCRDPGAGPDISILSKDPIAINADARITLRQNIGQFPMRGGLPSIEDAGCG